MNEDLAPGVRDCHASRGAATPLSATTEEAGVPRVPLCEADSPDRNGS